jgi:peptidoglycan/LPS O-acetylase OafA/YrhL
MKSRRIQELDGIRGIAILMVVVWHYFTCLGKSPESGFGVQIAQSITSCFWSGVDLFFVLSGFLIGGIILDNFRKENFLKVFWMRRLCRIAPIYYLLLLSCLLFYTFLDHRQYGWLFHDLMPWWSYVSFTQNIMMGFRETFGGHFLGVTWSLAVEEQFYLLAPLLIICLGKRKWIFGVVSLIAVAFVLRLISPGFHTYVNVLFRMDSLLIGATIAIVCRNEAVWAILEKSRNLIGVLFLQVLILTVILQFGAGFRHFMFGWFALLYGLFLLSVLLFQGERVVGFLRLRLLAFFGMISYSLYMLHQLVLGLMHGWIGNGTPPSLETSTAVTITIISFILSALVAWVSTRTYEAYFLRMGRSQQYAD